MLQNKTQVETVNFRLYFKVIIRQNDISFLNDFFFLKVICHNCNNVSKCCEQFWDLSLEFPDRYASNGYVQFLLCF